MPGDYYIFRAVFTHLYSPSLTNNPDTKLGPRAAALTSGTDFAIVNPVFVLLFFVYDSWQLHVNRNEQERASTAASPAQRTALSRISNQE